MNLNREGHLEKAEELLRRAEDNVGYGADSNARSIAYTEAAKAHIKLATELRLTFSKS